MDNEAGGGGAAGPAAGAAADGRVLPFVLRIDSPDGQPGNNNVGLQK